MIRLAISILTAAVLCATPRAIAAQELDAAGKAALLDREAPRLLSEHDVPSVGVAYIEDGEIAFVRHYGEQEWGVEASEDTLYNVASLTKPVTAETVLRLVAQDRLGLDTRLSDTFTDPDVADDGRVTSLTPERVMHHETGFPNWRYETEGTLRFLRSPGEAVGYSGEGYEWMAKAIAAKLDTSFEELARDMIFDAEGLENMSYTERPWFRGRLAVPFKRGTSVRNVVRTQMSASDDLRTTVRDYARFMLAVWEESDMPPNLRKEQTRIARYHSYKAPCVGDARADFCPRNMGWGLGWFVYDYGDRQILQHDGGDVGEATLAFYVPQRQTGVVVFTNGANGNAVTTRIAAMLYDDAQFAQLLQAPWVQ